MKDRNLLKRLCALLCTVLLLTSLCGCAGQETDAPELLKTITVTPSVATVCVEDIFNQQFRFATVQPLVTGAAFPVAGTVKESYHMVGDTVAEGELLAKLDDTSLNERIEAQKDSIAANQSKYAATNRQQEIKIEIAQINLSALKAKQAALREQIKQEAEERKKQEEAAKETASSGETSSAEPASPSAAEMELNTLSYEIELKELDIQEYELQLKKQKDSQQKSLQTQNLALAQLQEEHAKYYLYAPCAGNIVWASAKTITPGWVAMDYSVFYIADLTQVSLQTARVSNSFLLNCERIFAVIDNREYTLQPVPINSEEDMARSLDGFTLKTTYEIVGEDKPEIPIGSQCIIYYRYNTADNALCIPRNALYTDGTVKYVYKVDGDAKTKTDVKTGMITSAYVQILSGLQEGDCVYVKN